jgi:hypothetical protein
VYFEFLSMELRVSVILALQLRYTL